jgi:hypothetical protein
MEPPTLNLSKTIRTQRFLTHWGIWMVIAYMALVAITVTGFVWNGTVVKKDAVNKAQLDRCISTRPTLQQVSRGFKGVKTVAKILVLNSAALVDSTPASDPQRPVRVANLRRIILAREEVAALPDFPVPTVAQCRQGSR